MKCVFDGCEEEATETLESYQGLFGGRKPGMHLVTFDFCAKHYKIAKGNGGCDCNVERLKEHNPGVPL